MNINKDKQAGLQVAIQGLEKKYGKGVIMRLSDDSVARIPRVSTGSLGVDMALGGGLPCGRISVVYGPPSAGKTTFCTFVIAEVQKKGGTAVLIDSEHAFDKAYAKSLGVDTDALFITQPDDGEQALDIADQLIRSGGVELVVIDSVAALVPKSELEGEIGDHSVGTQARLMSKALRRLTGSIHKTGAICLFVNQLRQKIGVVFGSKETTPGGNALKFYASVLLDVRKVAQVKRLDEVVGHRVKVKVAKNKVAPPFKTASFDLLYGRGIDKLGEIVDLGLSLGVLTRSGAWLSYKDRRLGQGREAAKEVLSEDKALRVALVSEIGAKHTIL